jgi:hypothetical protein
MSSLIAGSFCFLQTFHLMQIMVLAQSRIIDLLTNYIEAKIQNIVEPINQRAILSDLAGKPNIFNQEESI